MLIGFFGHDINDAAIRRRIEAFLADGIKVIGFMMRRQPAKDVAVPWVDLGQTRDAAYGQRMAAIIKGARLAARHGDQLGAADLIYARNLDMLLCAFLAKRLTALRTPVVYECLDVHRLLTRNDGIGKGLRLVERNFLRRSVLLTLSSPAFETEYFAKWHKRHYKFLLLENRMTASDSLSPRPELENHSNQFTGERPLRIGWYGILRCNRSLRILCKVAEQFGRNVRLDFRGFAPGTAVPDFHDHISAIPNISFGGRYKAPDDLADIYSQIDMIWAGDFFEKGFNSKWLLPNRIYEGGYFAVPPIAPADCETGSWIDGHGVGFTVEEPIEQTLPALIKKVLANPGLIHTKRRRLMELPDSAFLQPAGTMIELVTAALENAAHHGKAR